MYAPSIRTRMVARYAAVPVALLLSSLFVWRASYAASSATTSNGPNNWTAGAVSLSDDDTGSAMFTASDLKPGDTGSRCIVVTYGGSVASAVKLYASKTGTLGQYLDLTVQEGTGGSYATGNPCSSFTSTGTLYTGTVDGFAASSTNFASGVGTFAPTSNGQTKAYRFTYTLQAATPGSAQGTTAGATFTWEAQSS